MDRRNFQKMLVSALVGGTISAADADCFIVKQSTTGTASGGAAAAQSRYVIKVRYHNKHRVVQYWARIKDTTDIHADVPLTVTLAADQAGHQVIASKSVVAHAAQSHIVRGSFLLGKGSMQRGTTFYCHVLAGEEITRVRRFKLKAY